MSPAIRGNSYAEGNSGGGAPEGNENARNNDGGAPPGNLNAAKHHGYCDPLKYFTRLDRDRREERVGGWRELYADHHDLDGGGVEAHIVATREYDSEQEVRDDFRRVVAMSSIFFDTAAYFFEHGAAFEVEHEVETGDGETVVYTTHEPNPVWESDYRRSSKRRRLEKKLGLIEGDRYLGCG